MREYVLRDFRLYFPYLANKVVRERWIDARTVIFDMDDGKLIRYSHSLNAIRVIKEYDGTEEEWRKEFSRRLYEKMENNGFTQVTLADRIGVSAMTINKYLHHQALPNSYIASKLAKALGCTTDELISYYQY